MPRYVKFVQGTPEAFAKLPRKDSDTLYVIYEEDEINATLYLGSKVIAGGECGNLNLVLLLSELKDIQLTSNISDSSMLVYDMAAEAWINKKLDELIFVGATETSSGVSGLVPAPEARKEKAFLCNNGKWETIDSPKPLEYDASNIYFDRNLVSNYNIGNISVDRNGSAVIAAAGKNIIDVFDMILGGEAVNQNNDVVAKPLDEHGYFTDYKEAEQAAKEAGPAETLGTYNYYGQVLTVIENNEAKLYTIQPDNSIQEVALVKDIPAPIDTYTKSEINEKVAMASHLKRKMINSVEEISSFVENNKDAEQYIYMVPTGFTLADHRYDEYVIIPVIDEDGVEIQAIERVGTWEVDLSDYSKVSDTLALQTQIDELEKRIASLESYIAGKAN